MNWTLEVVVVPVADVDRSIAFYTDQLGFALDHDTVMGDDMRFVQLTPPGSGCSIVIGKGITKSVPGTYNGMQLVVADIQIAHAQLVERGVEVSDVEQIDPRDGGTLCHFADPDGNTWVVQEIKARADA
jgi:catechol 2,3-dioxygenase-like lactoylglutathione lyase family enzyme